MVFGNKFLTSTDSIIVIETEIKSVENILFNLNEEYLSENILDDIDNKVEETIDKIYNKFANIAIKILEAISKVAHKIFPPLYKFIQKIIVDIRNDSKMPLMHKIEFKGKLNIEYKVFSEEGAKFINNINSDEISGYIDRSIDIIQDYRHNKDINAYNGKVDDLRDSFEKLYVKNYADIIKDKGKILLDVEDTIESADDYFKLDELFRASLGKVKEDKDNLENLQFKLKQSVNRAKNGFNKIEGLPSGCNSIGAAMVTTISNIYKLALDSTVSVFKSQFILLNRINKFRITEFDIEKNSEYEVPQDFKEL